MIALLLQSDALPEFYRAVKQQFNKGGTFGSAMIALGALAALVLVVYVLSRMEDAVKTPVETDDPSRLFRELLPKLGLSTPQRQLLDAIARDLRLAHPTLLLLSERLFDEYVIQWHSGKGASRSADLQHREAIRKVKSRLFPTGVGWVSSGPERV